MVNLLDQTFREAFGRFWTAAQASAAGGEISPNFLSRIRIINGVFFNVSADASNAEADIIRVVLKRLGPARVNEGHVQDLLWTLVARAVSGENFDDPASDAAREIEQDATETHRFLAPCFAVAFALPVQEVQVGPVRIVSGNILAEQLNASLGSSDRRFQVRGIAEVFSGAIVTLLSPLRR